MRIGITGQSGFIGTHLYNYMGLMEDIERVPFKDEYFRRESRLREFVSSCDAIVHMAAMNRHNDPQELYDINIQLVQKLIDACESTNATPHILFSSSTQEERDNLYGKSKYVGRKLFEKWAAKTNARFTGFIIPNVFGPFGHPYYNSFIATFCHQLTHNEQPKIELDGIVKLIYVGELVKTIADHIFKVHREHQNETIIEEIRLKNTSEGKVSYILLLLEEFKKNYFEQGIMPNLTTPFERDLFNTFACYIDHEKFFPFHLTKHMDNRGAFTEVIKLNSGGQVSFSVTKPGITRGNHFHTRKAERFAVIKGKARIQLRKIGTDKIMNFDLDGNKPSFVDMPVWHTHNITNTGNDDLYTIFWISEHYNPDDPDTFYEPVSPEGVS